MSSDTIPIGLTLAERHTLHDLVTSFIHERAFEAVQYARHSSDLEQAANRTRRLAYLVALAEDDAKCLPVAELDELRADLILWASETDDTVEDPDKQIPEAESDPELSYQERIEAVRRLRSRSAVDYAHECVCERIVVQINKAREAVTA